MPVFVKSKYESDSGDIHPIRLTSSYEAVAGTAPEASVNNSIKVKISKTKREHGLRPRGRTLARTVGTAPNQFVKYSFLPLRRAVDEANAAYAIGQTVTINSVAWEIIGKVPERY